MKAVTMLSVVVLVSGCAGLPQTLPRERFPAQVLRGDYGWGQTQTTVTTREYTSGVPTGRTFVTTQRP